MAYLYFKKNELESMIKRTLDKTEVSANCLKGINLPSGKKDLVGTTVGFFRIISYAGTRKTESKVLTLWNAMCACGNEVTNTHGTLKKMGACRKCRKQIKNELEETRLRGKRFGRRIVVERDVDSNNKWIWECECGNRGSSRISELNKAAKNNCRCRQCPPSFVSGCVYGSFRVDVFRKNKIRLTCLHCKKREWCANVTTKSITQKKCSYCGTYNIFGEELTLEEIKDVFEISENVFLIGLQQGQSPECAVVKNVGNS